ncbi:heavy-metal-associated domain-containing protein [Nonomuraea sp. NPDC059194]|uniref:heavy-metal-associated domain-containing protein n=1 Tax=Nonomuraea sp. NPDC059194 TaxID=3346764 RepID=UPI003699C8B2
MSTSTYKVTGMTCNGCAGKVKTRIGAVAGVSAIDVDLATGHVKVTSEGQIDDVTIVEAVEEVGYEAVLV